MRKMFKAAASLAVGCAMLSTSAFAALTGSPALSNDRSAVNVTVSGVGASKESTILVLKGARTEMPATINEDDIVYINQQTADGNGNATYSMPLGTRVGDATAVTVFAGATDESAATLLGSVTVVSEPVVVDPTAIAIHKDGAAVTKAIQMNELDEAIQLTAVLSPENATGTVVWTSANTDVATVSATGLVTPVAPGTVKIKAAVGNIEASVDLLVWRYGDLNGDGITDLDDCVQIEKYVAWDFESSAFADYMNLDELVPLDENDWIWKAANANFDEGATIDLDDCVEIEKYVAWDDTGKLEDKVPR